MATLKQMTDAPYSGLLLKPISKKGWKSQTLLDNFEGSVQFKTQLDERVSALFAHFEIKPGPQDPWGLLALLLALKHVPAFKTLEQSIKRDSWSYAKLRELRNVVIRESARKRDGSLRARPIAISHACRNLAKLKAQDRPPILRNLSAATISRKYYDARKERARRLTFSSQRWITSILNGRMTSTPKLSHPWWQEQIRRGDPNAKRLEQSNKSLLELEGVLTADEETKVFERIAHPPIDPHKRR